MEAVEPHCHSLEPFFDVVPLLVVGLTVQFLPSKGSQIATGIHEKLCLGNIVFLFESREKGRPQKSEISDGLHENGVFVNVGVSLCASESLCVQLQIAP